MKKRILHILSGGFGYETFKPNSCVPKSAFTKQEEIHKENKMQKNDINIGDSKGKNTLMKAIEDTNISQITNLLTLNQVDINVVNANGDGALHYAAINKNPEPMILLIRAGIDLNQQNKVGDTALHVAITQKNIRNALILIDAKADIHIGNEHGQTPLLLACRYNLCVVAQRLLAVKANPNAMDFFGNTPLFFAARHGNLELIEDLKNNKVLFVGKDAELTASVSLLNGQIKAFKKLSELSPPSISSISFLKAPLEKPASIESCVSNRIKKSLLP